MITIYRIPKSNVRRGTAFYFGFCLTLYFPVFPPVKVVDIACVIAFIVFVAGLKKPTMPVFLFGVSISAVFIATAIPSAQGDMVIGETIEAALGASIALVAFFIAFSMRADEVEALILGFVVSVVAFAVIGSLGRFGVIPQILPQHVSSFGERSIGGMPDPNRFGFVLVIGLSFLLAALSSCKPRGRLILALVFVCLAIINLTQRSALLLAAAVLVLGFMLFLTGTPASNSRWSPILIRACWLILISWIGAMLLIFWPLGDLLEWEVFNIPVVDKFIEKGMSYTEDIRAIKLRAGLDAFGERPVLGYGFGGYRTYAEAGTSHNSFIETLVNGGLVGLLSFVSAILICGRNLYKSWHSRVSQCNKWVIGGCLISYVAMVLYGFVLNYQYLLVAYAFLGLFANPIFSRRASPLKSVVRDIGAVKVK